MHVNLNNSNAGFHIDLVTVLNEYKKYPLYIIITLFCEVMAGLFKIWDIIDPISSLFGLSTKFWASLLSVTGIPIAILCLLFVIASKFYAKISSKLQRYLIIGTCVLLFTVSIIVIVVNSLLRPGNTYLFGKYPQTQNGDYRHIEWIILEVDTNKKEMKLISKKILDHILFADVSYIGNDWSTNNNKNRAESMQKLLHNTFYENPNVFSADERKRIIENDEVYYEGLRYNAYICLPSIVDVRKLSNLPDDSLAKKRTAEATAYALNKAVDSIYSTRIEAPDKFIDIYNHKSPYILVNPIPIDKTKYNYYQVAGVDTVGRIVTNNSSGYIVNHLDKELYKLFIVDNEDYGIRIMIRVRY
ncbi:hypothetical protein FACS1894184_15320 [Clostridia bacterium]|nr:hypothetical protein FACS1894184_15320 [Clostridia bacterium]